MCIMLRAKRGWDVCCAASDGSIHHDQDGSQGLTSWLLFVTLESRGPYTPAQLRCGGPQIGQKQLRSVHMVVMDQIACYLYSSG